MGGQKFVSKIGRLSQPCSCNGRNFENLGKVVAVSVPEFYQSIAAQLYSPRL